MQRQEGGNLSTKLMFALVMTEYTRLNKKKGATEVPPLIRTLKERIMQRRANRRCQAGQNTEE